MPASPPPVPPPFSVRVQPLLAPLQDAPQARATHWGQELRTALSAEIRNTLADIPKTLETPRDARPALQIRANRVDQIICTLYECITAHLTMPPFSIIATGGYGRCELAPYSDVDILFLSRKKIPPTVRPLIETMLYILWDSGLKVGYAVRTLKEAINYCKTDVPTATAMLEARALSGDSTLTACFLEQFQAQIINNNRIGFVQAKIQERNLRHQKTGDARFVLEPNIKDGKGGLRDLQTLLWIAKIFYGTHNAAGDTTGGATDDVAGLVNHGVLNLGEARQFTKAMTFLRTVRWYSHTFAERAEEHLTFDLQPEIAAAMGYRDRDNLRGVEILMRHYFLCARMVGRLSNTVFAALEDGREQRAEAVPLKGAWAEYFTTVGKRLALKDGHTFTDDPLLLLRIFFCAHQNQLSLHPATLADIRAALHSMDDTVRHDPQAAEAFLALLCDTKNPERAMMAMNDAGVLSCYMPDFAKIVGQMQYDMYHVYTVDEHTIRAIGIIHRIENGELDEELPVSSHIIGEVRSMRVLYMAVLLHDIAKGRKGDHSKLGAEIALEVCARMGFNEWETRTVSWLVLHHLLMSRTAFRRDLDDPKTVADFIGEVQSPEQLRLLLLLTVCDIRAVGPKVWNGWKAELLRTLYHKAQEALSGASSQERTALWHKDIAPALKTELKDWSNDAVSAFIDRWRTSQWLSIEPALLAHYARLIHATEECGQGTDVHISVDGDNDISEIVVLAQAQLFRTLTGAIALSNAEVLGARIVTLSDGLTLYVFHVQNTEHRAYANTYNLKRLRTRLMAAIEGRLRTAKELDAVNAGRLPSRHDVFRVPPRVIINNALSKTATVIEVNGRDRPGLLHDIAVALHHEQLQITTAHISTWGERAVDVFYVRDVFGMQIINPTRLNALTATIEASITPPSPAHSTARQAVS